MSLGKFRHNAVVAVAATLPFFCMPSAHADDAKILERLNHLDQRVDMLEGEVKERNTKIEQLEKAVKDRDTTIQSLKTQAPAAGATAVQPVAGPVDGNAVPAQQAGMPAATGADQAAAATFAAQIQPAAGQPADEQRLDNLERTVRQLNEITNAQAEEIAKPKGPKVTTQGGLKVESADGQFSFQPFGRFHLDGAWYDQDKSHLGDGFQVRRARLGATGKMFGDWMYKVEADFGRDTGNGKVGLKEAWIKYVGLDPAEFLVGNVPVPFGLEMYTSDNFVTFIERAMPSTLFGPERLMGGVGGYYAPNWSFAAGAYGASVDTVLPATPPANGGGTFEGDQQFVTTARATFDPIIEKTKLVHFGLGFAYENPEGQSVSFSAKPESNVTAAKFLSTGTIANMEHLYIVNPELALIYGPASLQGEYFYVPVTRTNPLPTIQNTPSFTLDGWYAQASYFLTGESRNYNPKLARFDRISPTKNLGHDGGWGAIELVARVSELDLDDPNLNLKTTQLGAGVERDYTVGLNWYVNPYIRFMANYILVENSADALGNIGSGAGSNLLPGYTKSTAGYDNPRIFTIRAQVDF